MKTSRILAIAAAALIAGSALYGCKKAPFEVLEEQVSQISADKKLDNPLFSVTEVKYDKIDNTVKISVDRQGVDADIVLATAVRLAPGLDEAIKAANANVEISVPGPDGKPQETLYENK